MEEALRNILRRWIAEKNLDIGRSTPSCDQKTPLPAVFRSITSDNGSEFASLTNQLPDVPIYYVHPYFSYERGLEKQDSLVRRFFPKGHFLDTVSHDAIQKVQDWINALPRKSFRYDIAI